MNHIPLPSNRRPLIVPCLAKQDFDGGTIEEYPRRAGWSPRPRKDWTAIFEEPSDDFRAFLQTWRFFGLVAVVFTFEGNKSLGIEHLTQSGNSPSNSIIDTSNLMTEAERFLEFAGNQSSGQRLDSVLGDRLSSPLETLHTMRDQLKRHQFQNSDLFQNMLRSLIFCFNIESSFRRRRSGCSCAINPVK